MSAEWILFRDHASLILIPHATPRRIFRDEVVPESLWPAVEDEESVTDAPSVSSIQTPIPSLQIVTPAPFISTPEPSIKKISALTPRPTMLMEDLTPRPTQNSFDFDFAGNTLSPVASDESTPDMVSPAPSTNNAVYTFSPVASQVDTPFPTSNGKAYRKNSKIMCYALLWHFTLDCSIRLARYSSDK